ncbi:MAG TPA: hypothetical protein PL143_17220 [Rhodocyclaceae bacterium]|nr:hypothetical protein [Rhodocyclaceae bacterium]
MTPPELAVSIVTPAALGWLRNSPATRATRWEALVQDASIARWLATFEPTHLYFGSEFCEHLLPSPSVLASVLDLADEHALRFVLLTPIASPQVLRNLAALLPQLPPSAQIVVNDWGVAQFVAEQAPQLTRLAGRILCRMIKDPRLGSADWAHQCSHALDSPHLRTILDRLGLHHIELDVPLFAQPGDFSRLPMRKSVHLPYAFVAKGRMCRPGSLSITGPERFAVGRKCHKECLSFSATTVRPRASDQWDTIHAGNTIFSRHSPSMVDAVIDATAAGAVQRLVVPGEMF